MMLNDGLYIDEIYGLSHIHDSKDNRHYSYENDILKKCTSPYMWMNDNMHEYLQLLEQPIVHDVTTIDYARNFFNYTVDKFYNDYWA